MAFYSITILLFKLFYISDVISYRHEDGWDYKECLPVQEKCEYWLVIQEKLTMIFHKDLVYAENGKLYLYNESPSNFTTEVPIEEVITADGVNRMIEAVNGTLPGPPIVVYEGQTVIVHIRNTLLSNSATIHFHGLHQKDTSYFDGMPYVTQCPIAAGQTFTHRFKAEPKGTFWYHSHIGSQRTNGVYGAFIVKERHSAGVIPPADMIMTVGDWHHESSDEVYVKMVYGNFIGRNKYEATGTQDGGHFSGVPWVSGLINGKGRYIDPKTGTKVMAPLSWFNVTKNKKYRFRVIGVGSLYPLRISVDDHSLEMVASDGYDFQTFTVESFIINPGERYDFILEANRPVGNYWIRAVSLEIGVKDHAFEAILHYKGSRDDEPVTKRKLCTKTDMCEVLNCPFLYFPASENIICHRISEMISTNFKEPPPPWEDDSEEYFLNFAFPGEKVTPGSVNGRKFEFPGINSLFQDNQVGQIKDYDCANHDCGDDKICYCHFQITLPFNKTIQMVWLNMGIGAGWAHPIHLHGHSFHVMKMEYSISDNVTGKLLSPSPHIDCNGGLNFCNSAQWQDASWENGNVPGLNLKNPPLKDTVIIPTGGYAVIRFRSTNPGKWFLHCHIEVHALDGMGLVINEAPEIPIQRPKGFPLCNHFYDDPSRDIEYIHAHLNDTEAERFYQFKFNEQNSDKKACIKSHRFKNAETALIIAVTLGSIVIVQFLIICLCAVSGRKIMKPLS
ncbi:uncharacterized protein LOC105843944 isoform X3 [Hydra vulgaris]|uniref:Uncharacterized protein LOC105843944 isoform X3 n=1 Tax=Hydra vulgaris TaxID=6087 RepID=A0ABM4DGT8_HYDVU